MRVNRPWFLTGWGILVGLGVLGLAASSARAQSDERPREHAIIPPAHVGTPLSAQIEAEAKYLVARGDLMESAAIAHKIHADAVAKEIQNSVDYVDAFFKRRELNRQWRAKENPNRLARRDRLQKVIKYRMKNQFQDVLEGDVTAEMNWLLAELSGMAVAYRYLSDGQSLVDPALDRKLAPRDLAQIMLSDNGRTGSRLVFSAADPKVLAVSWPPGLGGDDFQRARHDFETARDLVLEEIRANGKASVDTGQKLIKAVDSLLVDLEKAYPKESRRDIPVFLTYNGAKGYLQSLAAQSHRATRANDPSLFNGTLRFEGASVIDLIRHMCETGLVFAPPQSGGERVYRQLTTSMRNIYLDSNTEDLNLDPNAR
jgi:hypothetical protein